MSLRLVVGACAALVLTCAAAASAASSATKPGCPVITRAQAAAALGNVKRLEHHTQHRVGRREGGSRGSGSATSMPVTAT